MEIPPLLSSSIPIVVTAILTTIGTFFITRHTHRLGIQKDTQLREQHARYIAIRVVCLLDPFVVQCRDVALDSGMDDPKGIRHPQVEEPSQLELPSDLDWKSIRPDLLYRILSFPNEIDSAQKVVSFVASEEAWPPDYLEVFEERSYQYGKLGLAALDLAAELRDTYGLPQKNYGRWDPRRELQGAILKVDESRKMSAKAVPEFPIETSS